MDKNVRFEKAVNYLKMIGEISKNEDVAVKMKADPSNVSRSIKGNPPPSDRFLRRFCEAYSGIFNVDWLISEDGEMLLVNNSKPTNLDSVESLKTEIERLKTIKLPTDADRVMDIWLRFMENQRQGNAIMSEMAELYKQIKGE